MIKNSSIYLITICVLVVIFIATLFLVPNSFSHEYYVLAANLWSDGLIPWLGYNQLDMPVGIKIISMIPNIELNQDVAILLVSAFHLINTVLLYSFMTKIGLETKHSLMGILIYLSMLIGISDFGITLEPFATSFMILSFFGVISHKRAKNIIAAILLAIAAMIKIQVVLLIPALTLLILLPTHRHHFHLTRSFFFILIFTFCFLLAYLGITSWSENAEWIAEIRWGLMTKSIADWLLLICNSGIFVLIFNLFKKEELTGLGKNLQTCAWVASLSLFISIIIAGDITNLQLLLPINIIAISYYLYKEDSKAYTHKIYYACMAIALLAGTCKIITRYQADSKNNPLLDTVNVNYQLQQETKNPIQGDVNITVGEE